MIAYLPLDWIIDEHSEGLFAIALRAGVRNPNLTKSKNSAANLRVRERILCLSKQGEASPFGSRMPKENPGDDVSTETS
jgi:hypothetical protein